MKDPFKKKNGSYKILFKLLVIFSFFGFTVNPIGAQSIKKDEIKTESIKVNKTKNSTGNATLFRGGKVKLKNLKKKSIRKRKQAKFRTIGCPSF